MKAQDYSVEHFNLMTGLSSGLACVPAQILEHSYTHEAFGSWWFTLRHSGERLRVVFDGRDSHIAIQKALGADWQDITSEKIDTSDGPGLLKFIVEALRRA